MSDLLIQSFKPAQQLVIYQGNHSAYVEYYDIIEVEGKQVLSEGKPLTKKSLKGMMDAVLTTDKSMFATVHQLLPENVIYYDPRPGRLRMIWYNKPQIRSIIGIYKKEVKVKCPAVLYSIEDDSLSMYVIKTGNKRPELKTQLYHSPFPNTYEEGNVCMGNVNKPKSQIEIAELIKAWEIAFWRSEFTGNLWSDESHKILKRSIKNKTVFPAKLLKSYKKTISSLTK